MNGFLCIQQKRKRQYVRRTIDLVCFLNISIRFENPKILYIYLASFEFKLFVFFYM